jgi:hypothetical protein
MTADLSHWSKQFPRIRAEFGEIPTEMEPHIGACLCGGHFKKGAYPRCPHCNHELSAELAADWIEHDAPGAAKGWRWQQNWHEIYAIVIGNKRLKDHYRDPQPEPAA